MQGCLFALVRQKWWQYTQYVFYFMRAVELAHLATLTTLAFLLKQLPTYRSIVLPLSSLGAGVVLLAMESLLIVLWWRHDEIHGFQSFHEFRAKLHGLSLWANAFSTGQKVVSYAAAMAACALYLMSYRDDVHSSRDDAPMYLLLGVSSYVQGKSLMSALCVSPSLPKMGVQMIIIDKMLMSDVTTYLTFLSAFTLNYFLAMYISLPVNTDGDAHELLNGRGEQRFLDLEWPRLCTYC